MGDLVNESCRRLDVEAGAGPYRDTALVIPDVLAGRGAGFYPVSGLKVEGSLTTGESVSRKALLREAGAAITAPSHRVDVEYGLRPAETSCQGPQHVLRRRHPDSRLSVLGVGAASCGRRY